MSQSMGYQDFIESTKQNKLHFASGKSASIKGLGLLQEPLYALKSSGSIKTEVYIHSLSSIERACESFFKTFKIAKEDKWGLCLSTSHVAGFSVLARSYFGKLQAPHFFDWSQESLLFEVEKNKITILSLVPTQIFDLVKLGKSAPSCLRMVFVGGAKLSKNLHEDAVRLGWPIVECYGSTETFAQMSYSIGGKSLKPFNGWEIKLKDDEICLLGPGLFMGKVQNDIYRSRKEEWFMTGDFGYVDDEGLRVLGKKEGLVKIKGSYFDFNRLKEDFLEFLISERIDPSTIFLVCLKEERDGAGIYVVSTSYKIKMDKFKSIEKIRGFFYLENIERSDLGKVQAASLSGALQKVVLSL